jgi:hypothetical protein
MERKLLNLEWFFFLKIDLTRSYKNSKINLTLNHKNNIGMGDLTKKKGLICLIQWQKAQIRFFF